MENNREKRIEMLLQMLNKEQNDAFLNYALAVEYIAIDDIDKAIVILEKIMQTHPDYLPLYYQLGKLYEKTGSFDKAVNTYKIGRKLALEQDNNKTYGELTEALLILEDIED